MDTSEKHNIRISEKIYSQIKEYCISNELKFSDYIEHLLDLAFSLERYGDVPFGTFKVELSKSQNQDTTQVYTERIEEDLEAEHETVQTQKVVEEKNEVVVEKKTDTPKKKVTRLN